jgi:hypothetical protein
MNSDRPAPASPLSTASSAPSDALSDDLAMLSDTDDFELVQSESEDDGSAKAFEASDAEADTDSDDGDALSMSKASFIAEHGAPSRRLGHTNLVLSYPDPEQCHEEEPVSKTDAGTEVGASLDSIPSASFVGTQSISSDSDTATIRLKNSSCETPTARSPLSGSLLSDTVDPELFAQSKPSVELEEVAPALAVRINADRPKSSKPASRHGPELTFKQPTSRTAARRISPPCVADSVPPPFSCSPFSAAWP